MIDKILKKRSLLAWVWLFGFYAILLLLLWLASCNPSLGGIKAGKWQTRDVVIVATMGALLLAAVGMHTSDYAYHGCGFRDIYRNRRLGIRQEDEQRFVGSVLSVESIRAAMVALLVAILISKSETYLHSAGDPDWHPLRPILESPNSVLFVIVVGTLAVSLATTMAALLCYDYATRFQWIRDWPKKSLLRKAHQLSNVGFYCLMWSLAVVPSLMDYRLAFLSILLVFTVMWLYYFFNPHSTGAIEKLILLCKKTRVVAEGWQETQVRSLGTYPRHRILEVSDGSVYGSAGELSDYQLVAILSFDSEADVVAAMKSSEAQAIVAALTEACEVTVLRYSQ